MQYDDHIIYLAFMLNTKCYTKYIWTYCYVSFIHWKD